MCTWKISKWIVKVWLCIDWRCKKMPLSKLPHYPIIPPTISHNSIHLSSIDSNWSWYSVNSLWSFKLEPMLGKISWRRVLLSMPWWKKKQYFYWHNSTYCSMSFCIQLLFKCETQLQTNVIWILFNSYK